MEISQVLLNTQNPDAAVRLKAEEQLNSALEAQKGQFLLTLTQALAAEAFDPIGRQAAGLYLKNVLDAKDASLQQQKIAAWMAIEPTLRAQIKQGAMKVLESSAAVARHTGAQLVAKIGSIELPIGRQEWPTLLNDLLHNVTSKSAEEGTQQATLEALGYLCEELEQQQNTTAITLDQEDTNRILTAIVDGIRADRSVAIRLAAVRALRNSLEFIEGNFDREQERNHIMTVVCEATQCSDVRVRVVAYECCAAIASLYYNYLAAYMETLFKLTFQAIQNDQTEVGLQSLEFWSSVCDVEIDLLEEEDYAGNVGQCKYYVQSILPHLIPLLTQTLTQQEEDQDDDSWNLAMAGATCLALVAQTVRDACVDPVMSFIESHIQSSDWRQKEAALMAFGSILDGPSDPKLEPLVHSAMAMLMSCLDSGSNHVLVRDTSAWALGRICELHSGCVTNEMLPQLMNLFVAGLGQEPRVSHNICYAIHNLAKGYEEMSCVSFLNGYFGGLWDHLLKTTEREDATESNLRAAAYEAISILIQIAPVENPELTAEIGNRLPIFLERLEKVLETARVNPQDELAGLQALLCGVILVTIQRLGEQIKPFADRIMQSLLLVFASQNAAAGEEAFMAVGALANVLNGDDFARYMEHFGPLLLAGLRNSEEYMVCSVAVGVVGDLCRGLEKKIYPYCDEIVAALLQILQNENLNRSVKPPVLSCFGDIALAVEAGFERYLTPVMEMLIQAASACTTIDAAAQEDEELVEYFNQLRESILEALTGITQGLGSAQKGQLMLSYVQRLGEFVGCLAADHVTRNEAVTVAAVGLLGDFAGTLGVGVLDIVTREFVYVLINECMQSPSDNAKTVGNWAQSVINELRPQKS